MFLRCPRYPQGPHQTATNSMFISTDFHNSTHAYIIGCVLVTEPVSGQIDTVRYVAGPTAEQSEEQSEV